MSQIENNDNEKIKKILKGLKEVKVSDDFEMRLKSRIAKLRKFTGLTANLKEIFNRYRLPAYAVSVAAVAAIGVLSYYVIIRSGITPTDTAPLYKTDKEYLEIYEPQTSDIKDSEKIKIDESKITEKEEAPTIKEERKDEIIIERKFPSTSDKAKEPQKVEFLKKERPSQRSVDIMKETAPEKLLMQKKKIETGEYIKMQPVFIDSAFNDTISKIDSIRIDSLKREER